MDNTELIRTGRILTGKLRKYMIPTVATAIAISLDEFVDSIMAANLLDLRAMTVINVASPLVLVISATYTLLGVGGSTLYALNLGRRDAKAAGSAFSVALSTAMLMSVVLCLLGNVFLKPLCFALCSDPGIHAELMSYLRVLLLTAPFIIGIQTLSCFLPAAGVPDLATLFCFIANAINLVGDYVYIRFLNLGLTGTAYATLTGYVVCFAVLLILLARKKVRLYASLPSRGDYRNLREIFAQGGASSLGQIGYTVKLTFYNQLALSLGGTVALEVFAVCKQLMSIMSIGLAGVADAVGPFMATLKGQKDSNGVRYVLRSGFIHITALSGVLVVLFELFPGLLYRMFNVADSAVILMATPAIRIFLLMFLVRGIYILFTDYVRVLGFTKYAMVISLLDGFVLLLPVALVCTRLFGLTGIWVSFPLTCVLILLFIVVYDRVLARRSEGRFYGSFLFERENEDKIIDMTIGEDDGAISRMSENLSAFCRDNGIDEGTAMKIGLVAEEMAVYTRLHRKKGEGIDILTRISGDCVTVDFRSEGTPFNPLAKTGEDSEENIRLLNRVPSDITYDYILGLNSTRFTVRTEG